MAKIKVLDASAPLGLPNLLGGQYGMALTTVISALSFSPDGEVSLRVNFFFFFKYRTSLLFEIFFSHISDLLNCH